MAAYTPWEILLAWIPNTDDTPAPYPHFCIYLGESAKHPGLLTVLGITSDLSRRVPGYSVDLPYGEGSSTKLARPSLAQVLWTNRIRPDAVKQVTGFVERNEQNAIAEALHRRIQEGR